MLTNSQRLAMLLRAESLLKRTTRGYHPGGLYARALPILWAVRLSLRDTDEGQLLAEAHGLVKQTTKGYDPRAPRWSAAMLRIDRVEAALAAPPVPYLGPIIPDGKPLLLHQLSHDTDGLLERTGSRYPADDFGWRAGVKVLAPEPIVVTAQSSAMGADAFYFTGESTLEYWLGHIVSSPANGRRFARGDVIGVIAAIPGADHGHLGIDARRLIGRDLLYGRNGNGPDYTYGAPTVGAQLARALAA